MSKKQLEEALAKVGDDVSVEFFSTADSQRNKQPTEQEQPKTSTTTKRKRNTPAKRKSGKENKSAETVVVPLTVKQKDKLEDLSGALNITMAEVMRRALDEFANNHLREALQRQLQEAESKLRSINEVER